VRHAGAAVVTNDRGPLEAERLHEAGHVGGHPSLVVTGYGLVIQPVRSAAAAPRTAPQLVVTGGRLERVGTANLADHCEIALGLIAQDAVDLLLSTGIRRVRVCGSDLCGLRFVDRSPAHNRRWCSMSRCGNRTKVRLHQARARQRDHLPEG